MRVAVAHALYTVMGGGEKLSLYLARALEEAGYRVTIVSCDPPDPSRAAALFGVRPGWRVERLCPRGHRLLERLARGRAVRLRRLLFYRSFFRAVRDRVRWWFDLVFETQSNLPAPADVSYIHFPALIDYARGRGRLAYNALVRLAARSVARLGRPGLVLTNSRWTAGLVYRVYGVYARVLHPPVEVSRYDEALAGPHSEKIVLTVSRLSAEKNLHRMAALAARLRDRGYQVYIVGASTPEADRVVEAIEAEARRHRADNIVVERDVPLPKLVRLMGEARYYVHPEYPEHFGMAVVEAMAAGLVPIVYEEGGAWTDAVSQVSPLLGYRWIEGAADTIDYLDADPGLRERLRSRARAVAEHFDYQVFADLVRMLAEWLLDVKRLARTARPEVPYNPPEPERK